MKQYLPILLCCLLMMNCHAQKSGDQVEKVTIEGMAQDAKAGAVVVTENGQTYYIEGLAYWKQKYINNELAVTGVLVAHEGEEAKDTTNTTQSRPSVMVIRNAEYKRVR